MPRILHAQMTQAAYADHSDKLTDLCRCVSQRAERGELGAQQRRRTDRREGVWDRHKAAGLGDHHFRVAAIVINTGIFLVTAVHEVAVAAELAIAARAAEKPDTHALTDRPSLQRLFRQLQTALADRLDCTISRTDFHQSPQLVGLSVAVLAITKSMESSFP